LFFGSDGLFPKGSTRSGRSPACWTKSTERDGPHCGEREASRAVNPFASALCHLLVPILSPSCHRPPFGSYCPHGRLDPLSSDADRTASPGTSTVSGPPRARTKGCSGSPAGFRSFVRHGTRHGRSPPGGSPPVADSILRSRLKPFDEALSSPRIRFTITSSLLESIIGAMHLTI
jgi:hypothetical protein